MLKLLAVVTPLRADDRLQGRGLDVELHGEEAYGTGEGAILVLDVARPASSRPAVAIGSESRPAGGIGGVGSVGAGAGA